MKHILTAAAIFLLIISSVSCNSESSIPETADIYETSLISTESQTEAETSSFTSSETFSTSVTSSATSETETSAVTELTPEESVPYDYNEVELSMLEQAGNPDYHAEAAIPYVAWTEVNLQKTMYAISKCYGYEFALPDASKKTVYDAGCAVDVIARTSTGYYRLDGDLYIPCDFLDSTPPDGADPEATSNTVLIPPVTTSVITSTDS